MTLLFYHSEAIAYSICLISRPDATLLNEIVGLPVRWRRNENTMSDVVSINNPQCFIVPQLMQTFVALQSAEMYRTEMKQGKFGGRPINGKDFFSVLYS